MKSNMYCNMIMWWFNDINLFLYIVRIFFSWILYLYVSVQTYLYTKKTKKHNQTKEKTSNKFTIKTG